MSRSYRKVPIVKDGGRSSRFGKQASSRAWRRHDNMMVHAERYDDCWWNKNQAMCSWDVNDWISFYSLEDALQYFYKVGPTTWWGQTEEEVEIRWKKEFYWK